MSKNHCPGCDGKPFDGDLATALVLSATTECQTKAVAKWLRHQADLVRNEPMESMAYNISGSAAIRTLADRVEQGTA